MRYNITFPTLICAKAVGSAALQSPARSSSLLCGWCCRLPWCLGWLRSFSLLPAPVRMLQALYCPRGSLRRFLPPRATLPLCGCWCPLSTRPPLPLPGDSPKGFPPLPRPRPPPSPSLTPEDLPAGFSCQLTTLSLYFPFPPPHGGLLILLRPRTWRLHLRWRPRRSLHHLINLTRHFLLIPLLSPSASFQPPPPPPVVLASSSDT